MSSVRNERNPVDFLYTDIPPLAIAEVAKILQHGRDRGYTRTWKSYSIEGEDSSLNHGIGHVFKAMRYEKGSPDRIRQLTKAVVNLMFQVQRELESDDNNN